MLSDKTFEKFKHDFPKIKSFYKKSIHINIFLYLYLLYIIFCDFMQSLFIKLAPVTCKDYLRNKMLKVQDVEKYNFKIFLGGLAYR